MIRPRPYADALPEWTRDRLPFDCGRTQWNLADLDRTYFGKTADPALLASARRNALAARAAFAESGADHQLSECDRLLAEIGNLNE